MLAYIDSLFLHDLLAALSAVRLETLRVVATFARIAPLLEEWLVAVGRAVLLFDDEVRWSVQVSLTRLASLEHLSLEFLLVAQLVGILTDVLQELASSEIFLSPLGDVVVWLLLLQAFEDDLVLSRDFHEFSLARLSVQTLFELQVCSARHIRELLGLSDTALARVARHRIQVSVRVRDAIWVLENVGHLFEENAVLPLDLSVPLWTKALRN